MATKDGMLSVSALQQCPLIKEHFPSGLGASILTPHLQDPALLYLDLDRLCEMSDESLRDLARPASGDLEECLDAPQEEPAEIEDEDDGRSPQNAEDCVVVTADEAGLQAKLMLIEPPEGVNAPRKAEMLRALYKRKITRGVRVEFINRLAERPIYDKYFRIAEAQQPVNGTDSVVTFHFNPDVDMSPRLLEDGTADYKNLDFVKSVQEGDLLCEITPATAGQDGVNIYGQAIPAASGSPSPVQNGANTILSEDGREIRAACDGQVFLRNGRVEVSKILVLDTVDYATGNIDFPGSIHIRGDVLSGFTVRAEGDITVRGVVQNAKLISGGNIALCSGIKGDGDGSLEARQDVRTLFIESCSAQAGGNIYADTILNSTVTSGGTVSVFGKRGYLIGGACKAAEAVTAVQIGNAAGVLTSIAVSGRAAPAAEADAPHAALIAKYDAAVDRLEQLAGEDAETEEPAAFACELARLAVLSLRLQQRISQLLGEPEGRARPRRRASVQVLETLYPNVSVEIEGVFGKNTSIRDRCTIYVRQQKLSISKTRL